MGGYRCSREGVAGDNADPVGIPLVLRNLPFAQREIEGPRETRKAGRKQREREREIQRQDVTHVSHVDYRLGTRLKLGGCKYQNFARGRVQSILCE